MVRKVVHVAEFWRRDEEGFLKRDLGSDAS